MVEEKAKFTNLVAQALDRAEFLKGIKEDIPELPSVPDTELPLDDVPSISSLTINPETKSMHEFGKKFWNIKLFKNILPLGPSDPPTSKFSPSRQRSSSHLKISGGAYSYTQEEKKVLLHSSHINLHEFVPFMDVDLSEKFHYSIPFTDKDGFLELSPKQKVDFSRWSRIEELFSEPKMVMGHTVDYYSIKQTVMIHEI